MDNVIRFPRDWFGSKDDLVPFGPAADRLEAAAAAEIDREGDDDLSDALTANDFWGEGAGALHQPVGVPESDEAPRLERVEPTVRTAPASPVTDALDAAQAPTWIGPARSSVSSGRRLALTRRGWLSGVAVAAMLICAVGVFLLDQTHASPPASPRTLAHSQVAARGGVDVSEVADLLATQTIREAGQAAALATQSIERAARAKRRALAVRRTKSARRTAVDDSRAHTSQPSSVSDSSGSSPSVTDSSSVVSSPPVTEPADTSSSSSSASSPLPPGPTTAGSAGSNCNPQCR